VQLAAQHKACGDEGALAVASSKIIVGDSTRFFGEHEAGNLGDNIFIGNDENGPSFVDCCDDDFILTTFCGKLGISSNPVSTNNTDCLVVGEVLSIASSECEPDTVDSFSLCLIIRATYAHNVQ